MKKIDEVGEASRECLGGVVDNLEKGSREAQFLRLLEIQYQLRQNALLRFGMPMRGVPSWKRIVNDGLDLDILRATLNFPDPKLILVPPVSSLEIIEAIERSGLARVTIEEECAEGLEEPSVWQVQLVAGVSELSRFDELFEAVRRRMLSKVDELLKEADRFVGAPHGASGISRFRAEMVREDLSKGIRYDEIDAFLSEIYAGDGACIDSLKVYLAFYMASLNEGLHVDPDIPVLLNVAASGGHRKLLVLDNREDALSIEEVNGLVGDKLMCFKKRPMIDVTPCKYPD